MRQSWAHFGDGTVGLSEAEVVLLAQAGDREALEALLTGVYPALRRYVAGLCGATLAEDVVQDALLQAYRKLRWLGEPAYFRAWLFRIASRLAFAGLRKARRWEALDPETADEENAGGAWAVCPALPQVEWTATFEALLDRVSPASRAVLLLHYGLQKGAGLETGEGLTIEEVAAVLELPVGTVKSRLSYGIATLRQMIKEKRP